MKLVPLIKPTPIYRPFMILSKIETSAITSRMWIIPPKPNAKNPIAQQITSIKAMV